MCNYLCGVFNLASIHIYRPAREVLREVYVFTGVCLSIGGGGYPLVFDSVRAVARVVVTPVRPVARGVPSQACSQGGRGIPGQDSGTAKDRMGVCHPTGQAVRPSSQATRG